MYDKVSTDLNFVERELDIIKFWNDNKVFEESIMNREGSENFTFFEGPPTANGKPHIGHILTRVIKDVIPRYKTMKGYKVLRKAGWDTHGLPVELEVEKSLGISGKPEIEDYGIEPFIKKCKESVWKYEKEWREMSERVGFWIDMDDPYVTYKNEYIESVWWALKQIWDKGLLYKGHKVVPYCPRCGTALSSHEVAQGYQDVCEPSVYAKFKVKDKPGQYLLAWTTTPWTLPSNVALIVNAKETYVKAEKDGETYILAKALVENVMGEGVNITEEFTGKDLEGTEYEPLLPYATYPKKACYVVCDDYVTLTDGTGIVHSAPAFGEDDARVGRIYDLPFVQLVDAEGKFVDDVAPYKGMFVKDADPLIIEELKKNGTLLKTKDYEHSYPFCWRCDTPLIYYARNTWFIEVTKLRDNLVANNETVNWYPDNVKHGRFGNFLENVIDWGLSRERYWGTPLPIWECSCGHRHTIGSIEELKKMSKDCPEDIELHRPYIDNVHIDCPECNGSMKRVEEVIDCWFDSGAMPFAQWHYPFDNKDIFDSNYPADFISEAVDQTRGWFYSLISISTLLFDKAPYKNVVVLGHVQDKDGQKMSKHKGNVVDPWEVLNKQGADAVRWYFYVNSAPWLPNRFHEDAVNEAQRKFMGTYWNTYAFYVLYANIDKFNPNDYTLDYDSLCLMDKWVLTKLNSVIKFVDNSLNSYKITEAARAVQEYLDDLSNWYIRRSRERFWAKDMPKDKSDAFLTLYTVLRELTKIVAPFAPFVTESVYQNIVIKADKTSPKSVHLCDFPDYNPKWEDEALIEDMDKVISIVVAGRAARNAAAIKNRQPISRMMVKQEGNLAEGFLPIIKDELNVKEVSLIDSVDEYLNYNFKPQLRTLGPKYGKILPKIGNWLKEQNGASLMKELNEKGCINFELEGTQVSLAKDDLLVETAQSEDYATWEDRQVIVVLDIRMTDELIEEGFVREVISKIQVMRKEADFDVMDRIKIYHSGNAKIAQIMARNEEEIKSETLANSINEGEGNGFEKRWNVNGEDVLLAVEKDV